jgi:hypothetical protein
MTTPAQVEKLYPKLDNGQLSALAFNALMRGDDDERLTILASVHKRHYQCLDQEFSRNYNGYIDLGLFYGMVYWKNRAYMEFVGNLHKEQPNDRHERLLFHYLDNVMAMDVALQEVCAQVNIDYFMAVKKMAGCDDEYTPDKCGKEGLVRGYVGLFIGIVGVNEG